MGTTNPISIAPQDSTTITCTVTDNGILGATNNASATTNIQVTPQISIDTPSGVTADVSYTFPSITGTNLSANAAYYTGSLGTGTRYNPGDAVDFSDFTTFPVTIFIYDTNGNCEDETSFLLDINPPALNVDVSSTNNSICLGESTTLTATATPPQAVGSYSYEWRVNGNSAIIGTDQTIVVSPEQDTIYECTITDDGLPVNLNKATATISIEVLTTAIIDEINDQLVEQIFVFPEITGINLSGGESYYLESGGVGVSYSEGDELTFDETTTYPIELFIYDNNGNGCEDETSFLLTIIEPVPRLI